MMKPKAQFTCTWKTPPAKQFILFLTDVFILYLLFLFFGYTILDVLNFYFIHFYTLYTLDNGLRPETSCDIKDV